MALRLLTLLLCFLSVAAYAEVARSIPVKATSAPATEEEGDEESEYDNEADAEDESENEMDSEEEQEDDENETEEAEEIDNPERDKENQ